MSASTNSIALHSAVEQLALLRAKKISPLELADEHIARIERLNPTLNAFVDFDAERVRAAARALPHADATRHPLLGLPISIKSSIAVAGHRCENGSLLERGQTPSEDAVSVAHLRQAGAVVLGTTNCPEYLMAYETDNRLHGRTCNPWDITRTAGGSSGGEAAAIAAGLSAAGLGSDSGGSVRQPAHCTGICSLKPTPGRLSSWGHILPCVGPFASLGSIGPMARTVGDVALLFDHLAGVDAADPLGAPVSLRQYSREDLRQISIAYFEDDGLLPVTPETRTAVRDAAAALARLGFRVRSLRPQALEPARQLWWKFFVQGGAMFLDSTLRGHEDQLSPTLLDFLSIARSQPPLTTQALLEAWAECDLLRRQFLVAMQEHPILLCPVSAIPAFPHGERTWAIEGQSVAYLDAMRHTQWFNALAMPAAVVPVGRSPEGLPIGVQIAGKPYADEIVLSIAAAIEQDFGYSAPPMASTA